MQPNQVALRKSPVSWSDWGARFRRAGLELIGSSRVMDGDEAYRKLNAVAQKLIAQSKVLFSTKNPGPLVNHLTSQLELHNEVNRYLWVFADKKRPLPEKMPFIGQIKRIYDFLFVKNNYAAADPLDYADHNPRMEEISLWEMFLQIRGRCIKITRWYRDRELFERLKKERQVLWNKLKEAQDAKNKQQEHVATLQKQVTVSNDEELKRELRAAQEEEQRLLTVLKSHECNLQKLDAEFQKKMAEIQQCAIAGVESKMQEIAELKKKHQEKIRKLQEENLELEKDNFALQQRVNELEVQIKKRGKGSQQQVVETVVERVVQKDDEEARRLKKEKEEMVGDLRYYAEFTETLRKEREKLGKQLLSTQIQRDHLEKQLAESVKRDESIRQIYQAAAQAYQTAKTGEQQAMALFGLLEGLAEPFK